MTIYSLDTLDYREREEKKREEERKSRGVRKSSRCIAREKKKRQKIMWAESRSKRSWRARAQCEKDKESEARGERVKEGGKAAGREECVYPQVRNHNA